MAITIVQHKSTAASTASVALAFTSNVTAGNLIVACASLYAGDTLNTPTDSQGNTYTLAVAKNPGTSGTPSQTNIYYAVAGSSGTLTVTATQNATDCLHLHLYEVSGVNTLDKTGSNYQSTPTTAATVSTSAATTQANECVIAFFASNNTSGTWTAGSGYSNLESTPNSGSGTSAATEDKIVSATGTQTATATLSSSDVITSAIATFYQSGGSTVKQYIALLGVGSS